MKWFKHYTDATEGKTLQNLYRKFGLEGEARYWRLIQLLAKQYEGNGHTFYLSLETIRGILRLRSLNDCRLFLDHLANISEFKVNYIGNDCEIEYAKLTEIKDNHVKDLQAKSKRLASDLPLEKSRVDIDKNRIENTGPDKSSPTHASESTTEKARAKKPPKASSDLSPIEALYEGDDIDPDFKSWLRTGTPKLQQKILDTYDHAYLRETIERAYYWQLENKKRSAGTYISTWIDRDKDKVYKGGLSKGETEFKDYMQGIAEQAAAAIHTPEDL